MFSMILLYVATVSSLTCEEITESSEGIKLDLEALYALNQNEISECILHIGRNNLTFVEANFIWNSLIDFYTGVEGIPEDVLSSLHYITIAIKPEHYVNMTFDSIDVISNFGIDYGLSEAQLVAILDRVRVDFKQPEDYTYYDMTALRQILCAFNKSEICRIRPKAYKETAALIGNLKNCNADVMQGFAYLAVQNDAFGDPSSWTEATVRIVGNVSAYLPSEDMSSLEKKLRLTIAHTERKKSNK